MSNITIRAVGPYPHCTLSATRIVHTYLDNKRIAYTNHSEFLVQVGKGKGAYQTRYRFTGDLEQAVFYYRGINIGNGYKKRLFAPSFNRKTLAKQFS
jgi:Fe-S oxidoreductase